jgi:hypothetical protein
MAKVYMVSRSEPVDVGAQTTAGSCFYASKINGGEHMINGVVNAPQHNDRVWFGRMVLAAPASIRLRRPDAQGTTNHSDAQS